jgi:tRNA(Ile)-lysidine synthase
MAPGPSLAPKLPLEAAIQTALEQGVLAPEGPYVCAVSGGQDSIGLLLAMARCAHSGAEVIAVHVDHRLRETSAEDAEFVRRLCREIKATCVVRAYDVAAYAAQFNLNVEEAARSVRYRILAREASKLGSAEVLTAHTGDDQAETVLLHLMRGSGLDGLAGMAVRQELDPARLGPAPHRIPHTPVVTVIRPLLGVRREDTAAYCEHLKVSWRADATNDDVSLIRNRVRHHLLPLLETYNPSIRRSLLHLAGLASEDGSALNAQAAALVSAHLIQSDGIAQLPRDLLDDQPTAVTRRVIRLAALNVGAARGLSYDQVERCLRALNDSASEVRLSQGLCWEVEGPRCTMRLEPTVRRSRQERSADGQRTESAR